jgi:hypothetical protein
MKTWTATLLVCDDLLYSLMGKVNLIGIYTSDIAINGPGQVAGQLVFFFVMEGDISERPTHVSLEITLPGTPPRRLDFPAFPTDIQQQPGRTRWYLRLPFLLPQVVLHPGRIEGKIIYAGNEIALRGPWITVVSPNAT